MAQEQRPEPFEAHVIPLSDNSGNLPPGIHPATIAENDLRFGGPSELRRVQMDSIRWMMDLARRARVQRIILNGSFVTDMMEPNDVDCVLLIGKGYPTDVAAADALDDGLPFLDLSIVRQRGFNRLSTGSSRRAALGNPRAWWRSCNGPGQ